jgi:hypothetical protein
VCPANGINLISSGRPFSSSASKPNQDHPLSVCSESIYSWPTSQLPLLHRITETLPQCGTATGTWYEGESFRISVQQMVVPGLKDGIALRVGDPDDPKTTSVGYSAYVARGGSLLMLSTDTAVFTDAAFAEFLTKAVARLDAVG